MPYSDTRFDNIAQGVFRVLFRYLPRKPRTLDVGPGAGKGAKLFGEGCDYIDAVEVWRKNIFEFDLQTKYREVLCQNVMDLSAGQLSGYDLLFLGDMLEHLAVRDAQQLIGRAKAIQARLLVQVPFLYPQGEVDDNPFERHLQADLTRAVMAQRYPTLFEVHADERLGLYIL